MERAHSSVQRAIAVLEASPPEGEIGEAPSGITATLAALYDAVDGRADPLEALRGSHAAARRAALALGRGDDQTAAAAALLEQACLAIAQAQAQCAQRPPPPPAAAPGPIRASLERPRLQRLARPSLAPRLRVAPPSPPPTPPPMAELAPPRTFEELDGHGVRLQARIARHLEAVFASAGFASAEQPATLAVSQPEGEAGFVAFWARECFDELAMLASQRRPLLGDDWRLTRELEDRMWWTLDAFASLGSSAPGGGGYAAVERLLFDAPAPDPERVFAATLIAGCLDGRDAIGLAERIALASLGDAAALGRFGDALALAPHPELGAVLRSWLSDGDPKLRELSLRVLAQRAELGPEEIARGAEDRAEIAAHVMVPMALTAHPALGEHLDRACAAEHAGLRSAAWIALGLRSIPRCVERLRLELDGRHTLAAETLLAALGSEADAATLFERALRQPTPKALERIGVTGRVASIDGLLSLLAAGDEAIALAAARALERITGAGLVDEVDIAPEAVAAPDLPEARTGGFEGPPLAALASDPRDAPAEGSPDRLELPSPDPERWHAWWREHGRRFDRAARYRAGQPFTPLIAWSELAGAKLAFAERSELAVELVLLSKKSVGFDVAGWVVDQERALERWRPICQSRHYRPGAWPG